MGNRRQVKGTKLALSPAPKGPAIHAPPKLGTGLEWGVEQEKGGDPGTPGARGLIYSIYKSPVFGSELGLL